MEKYSSSDRTSYILGISLTIEAIENIPEQMERVYLSEKCIHNNQYEALCKLCKRHNIEIIEDSRTVEKLSVKENCYGIGVFRKFYHPLQSDRHIVLYDFSDPGELGTIMRSATAFDLRDIALVGCHLDYFDPKIIRSSMGGIFHQNIEVFATIEDYRKKYPAYELYPFAADGKKELSETVFNKPFSLLIPQRYHQLDGLYENAMYLKHDGDEISLSALSSIVFNYCYHQNAVDNCSVCRNPK